MCSAIAASYDDGVGRRAFTSEQERQIVAGYRRGRSVAQLVEAVGGSGTSVINVLKRHGIDRRSLLDARGSSIAQGDPVLREKALRLYVEGLSVRDLSKRFGCSTTVISNLLRGYGIKLHPGSQAYPRFKTQADCEAAAAKYAAGESTKELARRYGCGASTIIRAIHRGGGHFR